MNREHDRFIDVQSIWTRYWDFGAGPPIILLHGLGASAETWQYVVGPLSQHYRVLVPDLIGFGYTDKPNIDYTLEAFVGFVGAFMESVAIPQATFVGHSLGGAIALRIAIEHPDWVQRLVIADTGGLEETSGLLLKLLRLPLVGECLLSPGRGKTRKALKLYFYDKSHVTDEIVDLNFRLISQPGAQRAYLSTVRNTISTSGSEPGIKMLVTDRLDEIEARTLVLWGAEDEIASPDTAQLIARGIPNVELHVIPEAGHNPMAEQPERFNKALLDFLDPPPAPGTTAPQALSNALRHQT